MITITFLGDAAPDDSQSIQLSDDMAKALESYRLTNTKSIQLDSPEEGTGNLFENVPLFDTVWDMISQDIQMGALDRALQQFPTKDVQAAQVAVEAAQANLVTVKETARATAVLMPVKPTPIKPVLVVTPVKT
jgi:hypothetical protein